MATAVMSMILRVRSNKTRVFRSSIDFSAVAKALASRFSSRTPVAARVESKIIMTTLTKTVRRVTMETYGYGKRARKLVVAFERGDLITIREFGCRIKDTARIYDVLWWMKRSKAAKIQMEKLHERKAAKAARLALRRQRAATRRLFNEQ
jgi:hypothetical protein